MRGLEARTRGRVTVALAALVTVGGTLAPVSAQRTGRWTVNVQYSTLLPIGDETKAFADGFSWRGGTADIEREVIDHLAIGASLGWHVLSEENAATNQLLEGAITGTGFRYVNSVPLILTGSVTFGSRDGIQPFFGVGGGTIWVERRAEVGSIVTEETRWHTGATGEVGVRLPRGRRARFTVGARYQRAFEMDGVSWEYVTFSLGYLFGN